MFEWIEAGDVQQLTQLLENDPASAQQRDVDDNLPLHFMLQCGTTIDGNTEEIARLIRAYPEALRINGSNGWLPLHTCSANNIIAVIRVVLEAYPKAAKQADEGGNVPLHLAQGLFRCAGSASM